MLGGRQHHHSHSWLFEGDFYFPVAEDGNPVMHQVYDGTAFLKDHPGGADSILIVAGQVRFNLSLCHTRTGRFGKRPTWHKCCGLLVSAWYQTARSLPYSILDWHGKVSLPYARALQDASDEFNAIHSAKAKKMLDDFLLGELSADAAPPAGPPSRPNDPFTYKLFSLPLCY